MTAFDFIWFAIRERLLMNTPYMKQWPQALALLAMPNNIHLSMPTVLKLADDICYHAGDRSVDVSISYLSNLYNCYQLHIVCFHLVPMVQSKTSCVRNL